MTLLLEAVDVTGPLRWHWLLTDMRTGVPLADRQVHLEPDSDGVAAFRDLYGYVRWHAAPDRRSADEARIVARAGDWAGRILLGAAIGAAIADAAPVTGPCVGTRRCASVAAGAGALGWPSPGGARRRVVRL